MSIDKRLGIVSYLAPNWFGLYQAIATYLGRVLQVETQLQQSQYDPRVRASQLGLTQGIGRI
jgi:phosphonate transport system substrate-binding protein